MPATVTRQSANCYWHYNNDFFDTISTDNFDPRYWQAKNAVIGQEKGRGTTWFVHHKGYDLVLRHYLRGGVASKLSRDTYLYKNRQSSRSIAEFEILNKLHALGLPVPRPVAAQTVRYGLCYRADILIERIPLANDLLRILQTAQDNTFYQQLGQTIAQFHSNGVFHADLNIQNILQDQGGKFWLIDFDRAKLRQPQQNWQARNLSRLLRSFEKEQQRHGINWQHNDWTILTDAYSLAMKA